MSDSPSVFGEQLEGDEDLDFPPPPPPEELAELSDENNEAEVGSYDPPPLEGYTSPIIAAGSSYPQNAELKNPEANPFSVDNLQKEITSIKLKPVSEDRIHFNGFIIFIFIFFLSISIIFF